MPPPTPLECSSTDCDFKTPVGCPSWELGKPTQPTNSVCSWRRTGTSSSDFQARETSLSIFYFKHDRITVEFHKNPMGQLYQAKYSLRVSQTYVIKSSMWRCSLPESLWHWNLSSLITEAQFLTIMKELSVIVVHKSIHLMNLWKMRQESDEPNRAFAGRADENMNTFLLRDRQT